MSQRAASQYQEIETLIQTLNDRLVSLVNSLKGRLTPAEEETLQGLIQTQLDLQSVLAERVVIPMPWIGEGLPTASPEADSIAYAQAIQYARDLATAIRQKKEQQRRLELTSQQLIRAEKLATIGQVAAVVAHELGNIITPLLMYAKLIHKEASEKNDGAEIAEFADQITKIANRASDMLRQLVDAARTERAMMIAVSVQQVIQNTLALLAPKIKRSNILIREQYAPNLPMVLGRPDQLEQVFINIGLNAFDAMPNGGTLTIQMDAVPVIANADHPNTYIVVKLRDTGVGIPPENISHLFEPFYTTKKRGAGSGLGLFVSYLIIDQHGGAIEVESALGQGTTFTIKLPVTDGGD
jgi:two-component system NtrC family sensor kinase